MSSDIRVIPASPEHAGRWNHFVKESNNGTVFHGLDFLAYHEKKCFDFHHLMFLREDELVAVLPGARSNGAYRSPAGASFGGFVSRAGLPLAEADHIVKSFIMYCGETGIREAILTPPMQVYHDTPDEVLEYAMLYNGFSLENSLYSSIIDLATIRGKTDLSRNTRHKINKAINKGVRIVEGNDFGTFYPILLKNKEKFGTKPTHSLEDLERIDALLPGMITLFTAHYQGTPIAGELLFAANRNCVLNFYTMHLYEHRNLFSVNYLVEHAIRWSVGKGYKYYDYGVSADTFSKDPMEPSWPLVSYKESMGSAGCVRKTYSRGIE